MTLDLTIGPVLTREATPRLESRCLFRWRGRDAVLDALTIGGVLPGTLTRSGSANAVDSAGATYACPPHAPRWEVRDLSASVGTRDTVGLRVTSDDVVWPSTIWLPAACSVAVDLVNEGGRTISGGGVIYYGRDDATGARLWIDSDGTNYRFTHHNGTSSVSATLATATPATGTRATLLGELRADGAVRLSLAVGGSRSATSTSWSSTLALASAWGAGARWRLNRVGSAGTQGDAWIADAWAIPTLVTIGQLAEWV